MPKRLSDTQKKEIIKGFLNGESIDNLSENFGYTKLTISRNIKKSIGSELFNNLNKNLKSSKEVNLNKDNLNTNYLNKEKPLANKNISEGADNQVFPEDNLLQDTSFIEIPPLDFQIDVESRKEVSSIPIDEITLPKVVFMIVDKKIELETKLLKDYPEWQFLPEKDLNSKTIEIYSELKDAKRDCKKDQKVIKIPNTNVFKKVSKIMIAKGISKLISDKQLIAF